MSNSVLITYRGAAKFESADLLRRAFSKHGYEVGEVASGDSCSVVMGDGEPMSWEAALSLLADLNSRIPLQLKVLPHGEGLPLPAYETAGAAGMDLRAAIPDCETMYLMPGAIAAIPTGISVAIPEGYEIQVRPRSGLAAKHGISIVNTPGTVDSDYRGEIKVTLINHGPKFQIMRGDRIAQAVLAPVVRAGWRVVDELPHSLRGEKGFGSTGR